MELEIKNFAKMTITTNTEIEKDTLEIVFGFTSEEADNFLSLSSDDRIKADFERLAKRSDFSAKIATTVIESGFNKLSAKQADIINEKSIFIYEPVFTAYDHQRMEKYANDAKYRQAGSSLR